MLRIPVDTLRVMYVDRDMTIMEIAKELGFSHNGIRGSLLRAEIPMRPQTHRRRAIPGLADLYQKHSVREICELTGRSHNAISLEMKRSGVEAIPGLHNSNTGSHHQGYPDPINAFFTEDSRELYYVVGFVTSDGNISTGGTGVTVSQMEREVLDDMGVLFGRVPSGPHKNGLYTMSLGGRMLAGLFGEKWGIFPNKSKTIRLSGVPDEYFGDWLRGYFDGNGCVLNAKKDGVFTGARIGIASGSVGLLEDIRERLSSLCVGRRKIAMNNRGWGTSYSIKYGKADSETIYHLMYDGASLYLKRKKDKFDTLMEQYPLGGKTRKSLFREIA